MASKKSPATVPSDERWRWTPAFLLLLAVLAWARIFTVWFAQDDFRWLARAGDAALGTPRVLSMSFYFQAMRAVFGLHPAPYHAVQLVLHLFAGWLLWSMALRRAPAWAATVTTAWFLTAPALFDSLHWISDVADSLAAAFLLLAAWLAVDRRGTPSAWLSLGAYALALASKEIAVGAAPLLALLHWRRPARDALVRAAACLALGVLAAVPAAGAWQTGTGEPYALHPLAALGNLPAFITGAALGFAAWDAASDLTWSRQLWVQVAGWVLLAAWLAALLRRSSAAAWMGFFWFLGLLAPVLMLERHFYLYYLACALPGAAFSLACLLPDRPQAIKRLVLLGVALLAIQLAAIQARHGSRLSIAPLPTDFVLRRALIARHAIEDLRGGEANLKAKVVLLGQQPIPAAAGGVRAAAPTEYHRDPWLDENVRAALADGDAVRLMFPQVREAVFQPWLEDADTASTVAAYSWDGHLEVKDYASFLGVGDVTAPATREEHERRAQDFLSKRLFVEARRELEAALELAPRDPTLLLNLGVLQANLGDSVTAMQTLERAVAAAPEDVEALYDLGLLQWRLGARAEARRTFERLQRAAPGSELARAAGDLLRGQAK